MLDLHIQEQRIARLKQKKDELGWSNQKIADKVFDAGDIVSLGTIKRVFSPNANDYRFKDASLLPIEKALGLAGDNALLPPETEEVLKTVIQEQRLQIVDLRKQIDEGREERGILKKQDKMKNIALALMLVYNSFFLLIDRFTVGVGWYREENPTGWIIKLLFLIVFLGAIVGHLMLVRSRRE